MAEETLCRSRILVVNQEQWVRDFFSAVIKLCGYEEYRLADTVVEALVIVEQCTFDLIITDLKQPQSQRLLEQVRSRNPGTRFLILVPPRAQTQHLVYYEQVDIIFQPLSLDETVRKIRYALRQRQLRQAEEDFRRLKQEVMKLFLS